jgi:hypothetical protein
MRMLLHVRIPNEAFNDAVRDGTVGQKIQKILEDTKPEAVYFTEYEGYRGSLQVIDVSDPAQVPKYAEPWYLLFDAECEFRVVMTPEDLGRAKLESVGEKWR